MDSVLNIFLLELAALFPVVNPPGSALVFLGMTGNVTHEVRRLIAWRVARNAFFVLVGSLSLGALILRFYGISIPVLRVAGGIIVAVAGWKLLTEGSQNMDSVLNIFLLELAALFPVVNPGAVGQTIVA
jgi:multiple antibiotic resistance protein